MAQNADSSNTADDAKKPGTMRAAKREFSPFTRRLFVVLAVVALALLLWQIASVALLLFLGILIAIVLGALSDQLSARTPIPRSVALVIVGLAPFVLVGLGAWGFESQIAEQSKEIAGQFQKTAEQIRQHPLGQRILAQAPSLGQILQQSTGVFSQVTGAASRFLDALAGVLIVVFLSIYLASDPGLYARGLIELFPENRRQRVREALQVTRRALLWWLLAQMVSMLIIGLLVWLGLMLLGIPLAPVLGLIAGLSEFVPIVGPIVAAVPAVLVAFVQGPTQAFYVLLLYVGIQQVESYMVTPLVQERGTSLPPALTLLATIIFGILFGPLGIIVATPLMVVVFVLTKLLYVEGVLGSATNVPGRPSS